MIIKATDHGHETCVAAMDCEFDSVYNVALILFHCSEGKSKPLSYKPILIAQV